MIEPLRLALGSDASCPHDVNHSTLTLMSASTSPADGTRSRR